LFSTLIVLGGENRLQPVLRDVHDMLDQPFDECSVGSARAEVAGLQARWSRRRPGVVLPGGRKESINHETTFNLSHELLPSHVITTGPRGQPGKA
jgi:hypothetical protein